MKLANNPETSPLLLIDGHSIAYRAFYAMPALSTAGGLKTGAAAGFLNMLLKYIRETKPGYIAAAFDTERPIDRLKLYPDYKAKREKASEDFVSQLNLIYRLMKILKIPILAYKNSEADDCLGTVAKDAERKGFVSVIVSSDCDLLQTVSQKVNILKPGKGISSFVIYDENAVNEEYGFPPFLIPDYKGLAGDASDNIPGGKGIGPSTAKKLIKEFGSVENILNNMDKITGRSKKLLEASAESIKLSKTLAQIKIDLPLEFDAVKMRFQNIDEKELADFLDELELKSLKAKLLGGDLQTESKTDSVSKTALLLESEVKNENELYIYFKDDAIYCENGEIFADDLSGFNDTIKARTICSFDIKPILKKLLKSGITLKNSFFDIALASYLLYSSENARDPAKTFTRLTGITVPSESWQNPNLAFSMMRKMKKAAERELKTQKMEKAFYTVEQPLLHILSSMELEGIFCDALQLQSANETLIRKINDIEETIYAIAGEKFKINSPKQLGEILYDKLRLPSGKKRSADAATLIELAKWSPIIIPILEYREMKKLQSSYSQKLPALIESDGCIRTHYDSMKTATGRLASYEPNLQNIPNKTLMGQEIRKAFKTRRNDSIFLAADYSQIELRVMAHFSGDEKMIEAFSEGKDIHSLTAGEIFGISSEEITPLMRKKAKEVNFGIIYGMSAHGLAQSIKVSRQEASEYIEKYFNRFPKVKEFILKTIENAEETGFIVTLSGRRRTIPNINDRNKTMKAAAERIAVNSVIQGSAADIIKAAMIKTHENLNKYNLKSKILLQIHDELLLECPEQEENIARTILQESMEKNIGLKIPLLVNIKRGKNLSEME